MKQMYVALSLSLLLSACGIANSTASSASQTAMPKEAMSSNTTARSEQNPSQHAENMTKTGVYQEMNQEQAMQILAENTDLILLDVRTAEEYAGGHIPNALNLPNEDIQSIEPDILPDKEQLILVYCRSGNRSGQAVRKLVDMGYTNVYNIGGINTWTGDIVQ